MTFKSIVRVHKDLSTTTMQVNISLYTLLNTQLSNAKDDGKNYVSQIFTCRHLLRNRRSR